MLSKFDKRAIRITELSEELEEAKHIISGFIWPPETNANGEQKHLVKCAKFAGCTIPVFSEGAEEKGDEV